MSIECKQCGMELTDKEIGQHQQYCNKCLEASIVHEKLRGYASACAKMIQDNIKTMCCSDASGMPINCTCKQKGE